MIFSSITKTRKVKKFTFSPRYYDADKEEAKRRHAQIKAEVLGENSGGTYTPSGFKDKWKRNKKTSSFEKKSNIRLVFIVIILIALFYWILYK